MLARADLANPIRKVVAREVRFRSRSGSLPRLSNNNPFIIEGRRESPAWKTGYTDAAGRGM
jgi:hypothetical protein